MTKTKFIALLLIIFVVAVSSVLAGDEPAEGSNAEVPIIIVPNDFWARNFYTDQNGESLRLSEIWDMASTVPGNKDIVKTGKILHGTNIALASIFTASSLSFLGLYTFHNNPDADLLTGLAITSGITFIISMITGQWASSTREQAVHNYNIYQISSHK